jgi:predicted nucleotidyltransferase
MDKVSTQAIRRLKEQEIRPLLEEILSVLRHYLKGGKCRIFLFGSWASLNARPTSDIDIAILGEGRIDETVFLKIKAEIDKLRTLRSIDVVDLHAVETELRDAVLMEGEEISL